MKTLILAGGGHAHLHVLKSLMAGALPDVQVVLISPYNRQIYSGMVPGWMAGHYRLEQCAAPLLPLVSAARVRFVHDRVTGINAGKRIVHTAHSGDISYDVLSLDAGAGVDVSFLAASEAALLPIRPLENFVLAWEEQLHRFEQQGRASLAVVGGGAAGVELALAARHRLVARLGEAQVKVKLIAGHELLAGHAANVVGRTEKILAQQGVEVIYGYAAGAPGGLQLADSQSIACDCIIAATGVRPAPWLAETGLALCGRGFVAVGDGQQSTSHPEVFAAGDISTRLDAPHARSGVYAVRAGPVLSRNLQLALRGQPPASYQPQKRSLYLLATGPQRAIMSWGGFVAEGAWAWRWKDSIDRRFMRQYDLAPVGSLGESNESA